MIHAYVLMMIMVVGGEADGDAGAHATADKGECGNDGGTTANTGVIKVMTAMAVASLFMVRAGRTHPLSTINRHL